MKTRFAATVLIVSAVTTALYQRAGAQAPTPQATINQYCVGCHNERLKTAGLMLDKLDLTHAGENPEAWEKVVRKVRAGMMPPSGAARPDRATLDVLAANVE